MSPSRGNLRQAADALRVVAEATASATGEEFFRTLVRYLSLALEQRYCFITRCLGNPPERARTLAFWNGERLLDNFEYSLDGTPCEGAIAGQECVYGEGVQALFPRDQDLVDLEVASYAAVPMHGAGGQVIGHLAVMNVHPFDAAGPDLSLLSLFAARAAVELERQRSMAELAASEERLRQVIDLVPHFIFAKDRQGRFILVNKALADAYGTTVEHLLGKTDSDFAMSAEEVEQFRRDDLDVISSGRMKVVEEEPITDVQGNVRMLQTVKIPFTFANSDLPSVLGVSTDITERKRAEHLLRQTAEELRSLVSAISHDLRAPLVNLNGFSAELRLVLEEGQPALEQALPLVAGEQRELLQATFIRRLPEALGMIQSSASRIDALTRALLRLSEAGRRKLTPERVSLRTLVDQVLTELGGALKQTGTQVEVGPLPELVVDRLALEQVLHFLLTNALTYLQPGRPGRIEIHGQRGRSTTTLHVRDNGRGIAPDDLAKVFVPFRRVGQPEISGEGMGLAYARALVRRLSGDIWCESAPGVGTVFWVAVPNRPLSSG